ncbi:hypothetical protein [uncultured Bacteroides sp.]|uniref:hypothetical protein n=2 Tax=uncultured Bacteroides sp. TaxID=162156 RepID=UPI0025F67416|nr:hypothetical protein [uncultured Bacteroides sp.]
MKQFICLLTLCFAFGACSKEDIPQGKTVLEDIFAISDNPNDPIQHKRYQIYHTYNVPVYFNDTISTKEIGKDWYGNPVMHYETVDLNWEFDSYNTSLTYEYDYIETDEEKMNALLFVEKYLEVCSRSMRPFSIMLANGLTASSPDAQLPQNYFVGFRTLVLYDIAHITDNAEIISKSKTIINNMILQKVKTNDALCKKFENVSSGFYWKEWAELKECSTVEEWHRKTYGNANVNMLFHGAPYDNSTSWYGEVDFAEYLVASGAVGDQEEAENIRKRIVAEIGQYGFIKGAERLYLSSPSNKDEDLAAYTLAIINMGKDTFTERFGNCPLVMQKFNLLYDYITTTLEIEL